MEPEKAVIHSFQKEEITAESMNFRMCDRYTFSDIDAVTICQQIKLNVL
jgi:hypothetical protein